MSGILGLMSDEQCYDKLREKRWGCDGPKCPRCQSNNCIVVKKATEDDPQKDYGCEDCNRHFNDLTGTLFQHSKISLKSWMCCLHLMGLNVSNRQIAKELNISEKTAQSMTDKLRTRVEKNSPDVVLSGEVELDEVYVVAGHKGHPEAMKKKVEMAVGED